MEGYRTTLGSPNNYADDHVPRADDDDDGETTSWCVRQVVDAGAIVLGKLSLHEFGMGESRSSCVRVFPRALHLTTRTQTRLATTSHTGRRRIHTIRRTTQVEARPVLPMPSLQDSYLSRWAVTEAGAFGFLRPSTLSSASNQPMADSTSSRARTTATVPQSMGLLPATCDH